MSKQIILICQGRSGSTTLMRMLNTIDGCNICGENWNMIGGLMDFYENMKKTAAQPGFLKSYDEKIYSAWYNVFDLNLVKNRLIEIVRIIFNGDKYRIWGFKEIRFGLLGYDVMEMRLRNFAELFPDVRMVFLFREDLESQVHSGWWAEDPEGSGKVLTDQLKSFVKFQKIYSDISFILSMEDMLNMNENFRDMFRFIGEAFDDTKIKEIINNKLDYVAE